MSPTHFAFDAMGRRALTIGAPALRGREFYLYEGSDRIASVEPTVEFPNGAAAHFTFLFDGVDHPLRLGAPVIGTEPSPPPPLPPQKLTTTITPAVVAYYELDLAGNVRRLRGRDGVDLGGYRYSAFGKTLESTVVRALIPKTTFGADSQPLRWKGMRRFEVNGVELYESLGVARGARWARTCSKGGRAASARSTRTRSARAPRRAPTRASPRRSCLLPPKARATEATAKDARLRRARRRAPWARGSRSSPSPR